MPRSGDIDGAYTQKMKDIGITLLEPYTGAKNHHMMRCDICSHKWSATPISKIHNYTKYGHNGCPECNQQRRNNRYTEKQQDFIQKITDRGFRILSEYDGNQHQMEKITVMNKKCGHSFEVLPRNIISRNVNCPICNKDEKIKTLNASSHQRSLEWNETASTWKIYKSRVTKLTRLNYKKSKHQINPDGLPQGKAGVDGAYHLDHIVPIRYCFNHNIPYDICAHPDNLQMLGWRENVGSRDKLKTTVPQIFKEYVEL